MNDLLLVVYEALAFFLLYTCFCRAVKMSKQTTSTEIRLAFYALSLSAIFTALAPFRGLQPDSAHIALLIAICTVQAATARHWRHQLPESFRKAPLGYGIPSDPKRI